MTTYLKPAGAKSINIAAVTRELVSMVLKLSDREKMQVLHDISGRREHGLKTTDKDERNIGAQLVQQIMSMPLEKRCRLLGELKAQRGSSKRIYSRQEYITPVHCSVNRMLINGFITDISKGGAFIDTSRIRDLGFSIGNPIIMNFIHPDYKIHVRANGRIARVTKKGLGIRFDDLL